MSRRTARQAAQDQALAAALQTHARRIELRNDPAVQAQLIRCDREQFDPAYRLSRLDLVAPR